MSSNSELVFGRMYSSGSLVADVTTTLRKWLATYIKEAEDQAGLPVGGLTVPTNFTSRNKYETIPGEELPKCVVIVPGLMGPPIKTGTKQYRGTWRLGVGIATAAETEQDADTHAKVYGAAVRGIILHKQGEFGGTNTVWLDEAYDDLPIRDQTKLYRAAALWFGVDIENIVTRKPGPLTPDNEPYSYHTAQTVEIDKEKL